MLTLGIWYAIVGICVMLMYMGQQLAYELFMPKRVHIIIVFLLWPIILIIILIGIYRFYRGWL